MKRLLVTVGVVVGLMAMSAPARAHDAYDDTQSHPLRMIAYLVNPVGWTLEWLIARPFHFVQSQPQLEEITGHTPHDDPFHSYPPYIPTQPVE